MLFRELLDRAEQAAQGVAGSPAPQVDRDVTAETLFPHAVRAVYKNLAQSGKNLDDLTFEHFIEVLSGEATLPDAVFREYLDRSEIPREQFASFIPFVDYGRTRFDRQMVYYALRGNKLFYSGDTPRIKATPSCTATSGSSTITGDASDGAVGDRFYLYDTTNGLICDAIIATINGSTNFTIVGKTLAATTAAMTGTIYDSSDDQTVRTISDLVTTNNSATVTSATAAFTSADVGRRLDSGPVDAIIKTVSSATSIILGAKATADGIDEIATIKYSPLILQAVGIPALPDDLDDDLELSDRIAEDVIVLIAAVLRGDIPLRALIGDANEKA